MPLGISEGCVNFNKSNSTTKTAERIRRDCVQRFCGIGLAIGKPGAAPLCKQAPQLFKQRQNIVEDGRKKNCGQEIGDFDFRNAHEIRTDHHNQD